MSSLLSGIGLGFLEDERAHHPSSSMSFVHCQATFTQAEWDEDQRLLAEWGVIYRRSFFWRPTRDGFCSVTSGKHPTAELADEEATSMAMAAGYIAPKWWEWWRWRENRLPVDKPEIS